VAEPIIEISNIDFAYGQRLVLKRITLSVATGTTVGVIIPMGEERPR
jgi:ABC-type transporter Mla maintaining outer membrane lipid asymmetry ATPase subunit MlaF